MIEVKVGDRVRCIDADPKKYRPMLPPRAYSNNMDGLKEGKVYTVRAIETAYVGSPRMEDKEFVDLMGIKVEEIYRSGDDMPFGASRFEVVADE